MIKRIFAALTIPAALGSVMGITACGGGGGTQSASGIVSSDGYSVLPASVAGNLPPTVQSIVSSFAAGTKGRQEEVVLVIGARHRDLADQPDSAQRVSRRERHHERGRAAGSRHRVSAVWGLNLGSASVRYVHDDPGPPSARRRGQVCVRSR